MHICCSGRRSVRSVAITAALACPALAGAAVINPSVTAFPASPDVMTVDANTLTNANRGISGTRVERQTFSVPADITVGSIFLSANNYGNTAFTIAFYATTAVNAKPIAIGAQVGSTITVPAAGTTVSGATDLEIDLDPTEQVFLPASVSDGTNTSGYIMTIQLADSTSALAFNWVHSNTGTDIYTGGRYRRDDGDQTNTRDFGLALVSANAGTAVPEPASLSLLGLAGTSLLLRRRRHA